MLDFNITKLDNPKLERQLKDKIDNKTKPIGSLGVLEDIATKIGIIQNTTSPELKNPHIVMFAADHGAAKSGVSPYPQEVTYQMVLNFLSDGAGINVFTKQNGINLIAVDSGVVTDFEYSDRLIKAKISNGTKNYLEEPAMTKDQCTQAIENGANIVKDIHDNGCNIIGFGEMGIGNTASASLIMSCVTGMLLEDTVGPGAGFSKEGTSKKCEMLKEAYNKHINNIDIKKPIDILSTFGGYEIAMTTGAMLKAAELGMVIVVDGFIITSALLIANMINLNVLDYCIFSHQSDEHAHKEMLKYLKGTPILKLNLRLGEGTGVALAYPIIKSSVEFINKMASFESANVSKSNEV